jgi:hypothetical protein
MKARQFIKRSDKTDSGWTGITPVKHGYIEIKGDEPLIKGDLMILPNEEHKGKWYLDDCVSWYAGRTPNELGYSNVYLREIII